jgi:hypothetical protein
MEATLIEDTYYNGIRWYGNGLRIIKEIISWKILNMKTKRKHPKKTKISPE